jgi:hypothetical protein
MSVPGKGYRLSIRSLRSRMTKVFIVVMNAQIEANTMLTIPILRQVWSRRSLGRLCPDGELPEDRTGVEWRRPRRRRGVI